MSLSLSLSLSVVAVERRSSNVDHRRWPPPRRTATTLEAQASGQVCHVAILARPHGRLRTGFLALVSVSQLAYLHLVAAHLDTGLVLIDAPTALRGRATYLGPERSSTSGSMSVDRAGFIDAPRAQADRGISLLETTAFASHHDPHVLQLCRHVG